jgi:UDP-GlcNAc:undecaprenyl-phosphate/decaprenyl-phosphate GlcNAc-1-phosphate transferase
MISIISQVIPYLVAACFVFFLIRSLIPLARKIDLVDLPDHRKQHQGSIPLVGGIAMSISLALSILLFPSSFRDLRIFFFCVGIITIIGALDDQRELGPNMRGIAQFLAALILTIIGDTVVLTIGDIFGISRAIGLNFFSIPFTIIAIIGVVNAFNMSDGHDGLTGSITIVSLLGLFLLSHYRATPADQQYIVIILLLVTLLAVFLTFNLGFMGTDKRVFLGDAGSMFLGLIMVFLLIELSQREIPVVSPAATPWIIGVPLLDMFAVVIFRVLSRVSPLKGDRNHLHHVLGKIRCGKMQTLLILVGAQCAFTSVGVLGTLLEWPDALLFWGMFPILFFTVLTQAWAQLRT